MNYDDALKCMKKGVVVESIISRTQYEIIEGVLLAEGLPVKEEYITKEERDGLFEVAHLIFPNSSDEEMSDFLNKTYIHAQFMMKNENIKKKNMIKN